MERRRPKVVAVPKQETPHPAKVEVVENTPVEQPVAYPASPPSAFKIDNAFLDELKKRAEAEFDNQLSNQLKNLKGQTCSADDTIRVRIALEVCLEPRELQE
jgi:hypothetical protein